MREDLGILRRIDLQNDIDVGEVESTSGDISAEEDARCLRWQSDEGGEGGGAASGRHLAVEGMD